MTTNTDVAVATILNELHTAAVTMASPVWKDALLSIQIDSAGSIVFGILCGVIGFFFYRQTSREYKNTPDGSIAGLCILYGLVTAIFTIISFCNLVDVWNYVALVRPDIWLAHVAVNKITG